MRIRVSQTGKQFHTNIAVAPDTQQLESWVEDVFPMAGTLHESLVNGLRRSISLCQIFAGILELVAGGNQIPGRVVVAFWRLMRKIVSFHHILGTPQGPVGKTFVPSQPAVLSPCAIAELQCFFNQNGSRFIAILDKRVGGQGRWICAGGWNDREQYKKQSENR